MWTATVKSVRIGFCLPKSLIFTFGKRTATDTKRITARNRNKRKENDYEYFRTVRKMQEKQLMHDVLENKQQEMSTFCPKNKRRPHPVNER